MVAHAHDGVIEAVEWTGDANWITGVQWHPERMVAADELAQSLFRELAAAAAARKAPVHSYGEAAPRAHRSGESKFMRRFQIFRF